MVVSTLRLTVEEKNYWKFCMLNVRVVPDALRMYFDGLIPPTSLATVINQNSTTISNLVSKRVINAVQFGILKRIPGTVWSPQGAISSIATSSADFDVSLLVCLLRNIPLPGIHRPAVTGWEELPIPNDVSPGAYLARIKYYRNEIAHSTKNNMNSLDFQDRWKTISEVITFCNGGHSPNGIKEILQCDLDGSHNGALVASLSTEIEKIKRDLASIEAEKTQMEIELKNVKSDFNFYKDGNLPKNISDNIDDLINKWRIDDQPFYITRAGNHVYDGLESVNIVMIVGHSGSGKSATARNVALQWLEYGFNVVPVESFENILEYRCNGLKQIFVMEDSIDQYSVEGSYLNQLERLASKLEALFNNNNAKLICTMRKNATSDTNFQAAKFLNNNALIIDLDHEDNSLLCEEKMSILKNHLTCTGRQNHMSNVACKECCEVNFAFPVLCYLFTRNEELFQQKCEFFERPFSYFHDEITKLYQRNKNVYWSLVICLILSGELNAKKKRFSGFVYPNSEQANERRIFDMISDACGLNPKFSKQTFVDSLQSVQGVYVKSKGERFYFLNDSFGEAFCIHLSKVNVRVLLECCDSQFLKERIRVISHDINDDQNIIVLQEDCFFHLANRFIAELRKGDFFDILCSQPMQVDTFIKVMVDLIGGGDLSAMQMETEIRHFPSVSKLVHADSVFCKKDTYFAVKFLTEVFPTGKTLLHWVVAIGCHNFFEHFWKSISREQQRIYLLSDKYLFPLALLSGCREIIKAMIESGAEINSAESRFAMDMKQLHVEF